MPHPSYIAVVDDDEDGREVLQDLLETEGYQVQSVQNGVEALQLFKVRPPRLAIVDLLMPVMDGKELVERMKADPLLSDVPIVIMSGLTASPTPTDEVPGARAIITKPCSAQLLLAEVRACCGPP